MIRYKKQCFGQTDLFSADIKAIDNQIDNKVSGLKEKNNMQEYINGLEQKINSLMENDKKDE